MDGLTGGLRPSGPWCGPGDGHAGAKARSVASTSASAKAALETISGDLSMEVEAFGSP
ncbi:hypothetical protein FHS23_000959 [Prauserella isguenensis]|uniref:Uncharacterized protein n=1 Tax=Prauserella isguenensis TaxID=1470180 RepID=A0A839RY53_9PSEU|nr:hypothetical protein [Prauserella isguenensis]MBB3049964.1 hypothetical protein [Prauserella isguenensis]